jgi:hypothetical protein
MNANASPSTRRVVPPVITPVTTKAGIAQGPRRAAFVLSISLALTTLIGTAPTILVEDLLHGPAVMVGSARGTALVMIIVAVPVMLVAMLRCSRGSARAVIVWLGMLAHLLYNSVMLLFGTPFNALFLAYVATLSLALWSIGAIVTTIDVPAFDRPPSPRSPVRGIAIYAWIVVTLNALAWLKGVLPGMLVSSSPAFLDGTGLTTSPTYVQDLAVWLPLMAVGAWWLWRRTGRGVVVVGSLLVMWVVESIGIAVDQAWGHAADPASAVASGSMAYVFAAAAVVSLIPVIALLRPQPWRRESTARADIPRATEPNTA